jgi:glycosyltransferase XagB
VPAPDEAFYRRLATEAGRRFVRLDPAEPDAVAVARQTAHVVPAALARRYGVVAISSDRVLVVATSRPHETAVAEALAAVSGLPVELVVSTPAQIAAAIERVYGPRRAIVGRRFAPRPPTGPSRDALEREATAIGLEFVPLDDLETELDPASARALPERLCRSLGVVPLSTELGVLVVGVTRPLDRQAVDALETVSAYDIRQALVPAERLGAALDRAFSVPGHMQALGAPRAVPSRAPGERLGELLVAAGALDPALLRRALAEQRRTGDPLGRILVSSRLVGDGLIARTVAAQLRLPYVEADALVPHPEATEALPQNICRTHQLLPLEIVDGVLVVAAADPLDADAANALEAESRLPTRVVVASASGIADTLDRLNESHYVRVSTTELIRRSPDESSHEVLSRGQRIVFAVIAVALCAGLLLSWKSALIAIVLLSMVFYSGSALFKFLLIQRTIDHEPELHVSDAEIALLDERSLPRYTILVPLYHEAALAAQLLDAIDRLDYPRTKLDVKILLEEDDDETIAAFRRLRYGSHVHIVVVPNAEPKTKPKACNYGLLHARGDYVVIYDAEDIPDPQQLKKAVAAFRKAPSEVVCVQAKLNYWNRDQNLLTRWFTAEYSQWFDLFLPGLDALGGPIPLGGTSNHFRASALLELGAWDPFNVTEDADVGIRLGRRGFRTVMIDSTTYEEANSRIYNWIRQRSRWVKGYMQTWLVHMRHPVRLWTELGPLKLLSFHLVVGGTFLTMLLNPFFWALTSLWAATHAGWIRDVFPGPLYYLGAANLLLGNFVFTYLNVVGTMRRGYHDLVRSALFSPLYWALMSVAAWKGALQLITRPSYWEKTVHGLVATEESR